MDTTVFSFTLRKNAKRAAEAIYPALDNFRLSPGQKEFCCAAWGNGIAVRQEVSKRFPYPFATRLNQEACDGRKSNADGPLPTSTRSLLVLAPNEPSRVDFGRSQTGAPTAK
jgi:hypothetical protein